MTIMTDNKEINHTCTDEITCPYCGHVESDSWEYTEDEGDAECGTCGKEFHYCRNITIDYSTDKIEKKE